MRIDKFLKVSRIIKRRTVANEACDAGRVLVKRTAGKGFQRCESRRYHRDTVWPADGEDRSFKCARNRQKRRCGRHVQRNLRNME